MVRAQHGLLENSRLLAPMVWLTKRWCTHLCPFPFFSGVSDFGSSKREGVRSKDKLAQVDGVADVLVIIQFEIRKKQVCTRGDISCSL